MSSRGRIVRRPRAERDVEDLVDWFVELGRPDVALRFVAGVELALERLARHPLAGAAIQGRANTRRSLRRWLVPGFPEHLIVYRSRRDGIEVFRVVHGARSLDLASEEDEV